MFYSRDLKSKFSITHTYGDGDQALMITGLGPPHQ
jgi:hypothetical protein